LILVINAGSSSVKFAVFTSGDSRRILVGQVERIGNPDAQLVATHLASGVQDRRAIEAGTPRAASESIAQYLRDRADAKSISAIGHRVVHGGLHLVEHQMITPEVVAELKRTQPLDRSHLPLEIALIEAFGESFPSLPQVACFDTAFHRELPRVSQLLAIPRSFIDAGVRRLGFHGLSYTYLMGRLAEIAGAEEAAGRVILAHLGAGASMAGVRGGKPIDTTMAFTTTAGLVMATRPGDIDPGLLIYLMREQHLTADAMEQWISSRCGLAGVSGLSGDMRDLLAARASDPRAAEAVDLFCYQAKKYLCALAGALGGVETIVFAGGIGEHAPEIRAGICDGLEFLGLTLDSARNGAGGGVISSSQSRVRVRIIPTDEEAIMVSIVRNIARVA